MNHSASSSLQLLHKGAFARAAFKAERSRRNVPVRAAAVALQVRYDVDRLRADWEALATVAPQVQPGPYHSGGWRGLSLIAPGGRADWAGACIPVGLAPAKTPLLARTPYLDELLDALPCAVESARLLSLAPDERIQPHNDWMMDLSAGMVRLHVPIVTHPTVEFFVDGFRYGMEAGSLWYADFSKHHWGWNPSPRARIHLVVDAPATAELLRLFPARYLASLSGDDVFVAPAPLAPSVLKVPAPSTRFALPPWMRSLVHGVRAMGSAALSGTRMEAPEEATDEDPLLASIDLVDGRPCLHVDGRPYAILEPLSPASFRMVGMAAAVTGRLDREAMTLFYKDWTLARCPSAPSERP